MSDEQLERLEARLSELGQRLELLEHRFNHLEAWAQGVPPPQRAAAQPAVPSLVEALRQQRTTPESGPQQPPDPRRIPAPPTLADQLGRASSGASAGAATPPPPPQAAGQAASQPPKPARDWEYLIGAQIGPKLGGALVLLAVLFFVAWGYSKGWFTPAMVFGAEVLFCLVFIALGWIKREEREEFGQVLLAIGSGGLYAAFAGGHLVQALYSAETMVGLFMGLSFLNLGYSLWRSSRTFWYLGFLGGLAAALMPVDKGAWALHATLHFLILVPAAAIVVRNRWLEAAHILWVLSSIALSQYAFSATGLVWRLAVWYAAALICAFAYFRSFKPNAFDPGGVLGALAIFAAGLVGFGMDHAPIGALHLSLYGASMAALAWSYAKESRPKKVWTAAAVAVPLIFAPLCFEAPVTLAVQFGLSILAGVAAMRWLPRVLSVVSASELALGLLTYLWTLAEGRALGTWIETGLLAMAMAATLAMTRAYRLAGRQPEPVALAAIALLAPLFTRIAVVALGGPGSVFVPEEAAALGLLAVAFGLLAYSARQRWVSAIAMACIAVLAALIGYVHMLFETEPAPWFESTLVLGLMGAALAFAALARPNIDANANVSLRAIASVMIAGLWLRLSIVLGTLPQVGFTSIESMAYGTLLITAVASYVGLRYRMREALYAGCVGLLFTAGVLLLVRWGEAGPFWVQLEQRREFLALTVLGAALMGLTWAGARLTKDRAELLIAAGMFGWVLFSRWGVLLLARVGIQVPETPALTVSWTLYALVLLALGFRFAAAHLRYVSILVLGAAVVKVLLVDLATTDHAVRVAVLLGLGLTILGGGYWYLRTKDSLGGRPEQNRT